MYISHVIYNIRLHLVNKTLPETKQKQTNMPSLFLTHGYKEIDPVKECYPVGHYWNCYFGALSFSKFTAIHFDGFMQERRNSIANALELRLSCTNC